jgi:hypothetical protein
MLLVCTDSTQERLFLDDVIVLVDCMFEVGSIADALLMAREE